MMAFDMTTLDDIRAAAARIDGVVLRTPLVPMAIRRREPLLLKAESLQPIGAFKLRGAYNATSRLDADARARGVTTASSGNHAQGIARSARLLGIPATIVMPIDAPALKRERVLADGATIVDWDPAGPIGINETAIALAAERGLAMIHPYDHPDVIAGQGTVGLEIAGELPDVAAVLVPVGGGGLASGVGTAIRALAPNARLIGVEPELSADAQEGFRAGRRIEWPTALGRRTIADGTRVNTSERTFGHIRALFDDIVTVTEVEIAAAIRLIAERSRLVAEPSGALTVAAAAFHPDLAGLTALDGPIVCVVSGGNVDPDRYREYLATPLDPYEV
jgi:threonine dehydratase